MTAIGGAAISSCPLLDAIDQAFQYIQEYTGFICPCVSAVFVMELLPSVPFLNRKGYFFAISVPLVVAISFPEGKGQGNPKAGHWAHAHGVPHDLERRLWHSEHYGRPSSICR